MIRQKAPTGIRTTDTLIHGDPSIEQQTESQQDHHQLKPTGHFSGGTNLMHRECSEASPQPFKRFKSNEPADSSTHPVPTESMDQLAGMMTRLGPSNPATIRAPRNSVETPDIDQEESSRHATKRKLITSLPLEQPHSEKRSKLPQEASHATITSSPATPGDHAPPHSQQSLNTDELISKLNEHIKIHPDINPHLLEDRSQE